MLNAVFSDEEINSSDEIEEAITRIWDGGQTVFQNWMGRLTWVIENGGEDAHE
jgi:hypothetical protein